MNLIGPSLQQNKTIKALQNRKSYFKAYGSCTLAQLYRWKEDNICQSIWDKSEVLWRTCWGTHWEPGKNEKKKILPPKNKIKRKKSKAPVLHAWAFPLAAWNFSPQKSSSSYLARANNNTSGKEHLREKVCLFSKDVKLVLVYLGAINRVLFLHLQAQKILMLTKVTL